MHCCIFRCVIVNCGLIWNDQPVPVCMHDKNKMCLKCSGLGSGLAKAPFWNRLFTPENHSIHWQRKKSMLELCCVDDSYQNRKPGHQQYGVVGSKCSDQNDKSFYCCSLSMAMKYMLIKITGQLIRNQLLVSILSQALCGKGLFSSERNIQNHNLDKRNNHVFFILLNMLLGCRGYRKWLCLSAVVFCAKMSFSLLCTVTQPCFCVQQAHFHWIKDGSSDCISPSEKQMGFFFSVHSGTSVCTCYKLNRTKLVVFTSTLLYQLKTDNVASVWAWHTCICMRVLNSTCAGVYLFLYVGHLSFHIFWREAEKEVIQFWYSKTMEGALWSRGGRRQWSQCFSSGWVTPERSMQPASRQLQIKAISAVQYIPSF